MNDPASNDLSLVLAPVSLGDFLDEHWEKAPLHIERNDPQHFAGLLDTAQLETLLSTQPLQFPSVQLSRRHDPVAPGSYTDESNEVVPLRLVEHYHDGATIVLSQAHQRIASLAEFRRNIQAALRLRCQANVYLSPPGKQGFNAHYDSHDVFILQVEGSKTFNFYEGGIELPYSHEGFDAERHKAGALSASIVVRAGDTLYIPRGVMHDAVANDDSSLHITLGVYAMTLRDALMEMATVVTEREPVYRQSLNAATSPTLLKSVFSTEHVREALKRLADEVALDSSQDCRGSLLQRMPELKSDTRIGVKMNQSRLSERDGALVRYRLSGQVMEFEDPMGAALEHILERDTVVLADLHELTEEQRVALCLPLLRANVLQVRQPDG